ncbi:niacin transporter [Desulfonispora thiosulfatigenes DSM 11270]|uniref:Niacin transporter n=1 Tax=Desulfonispora thiosulfatigenes DSM 11270 TaxID=656914 RepID=A0A1W1VSG1_DESTI|nr:ECF transporter S component [Desulfonispora thiosulfatigenes]SMB96213.1 niacin transporter [Desulfonispora thiosulfatigenes DSM 11270]
MNTKTLVIGALLTSLALIIPLAFGGFLGVNIPPFSATLASHVPVMLAMTINPLVAFMVGAGSAFGFLIKLGPIVGARAFTHVIFAVMGAKLIQKGFSFKNVLLVTAPIHAIAEALIVIPFGFSLYDIGMVIGVGTFLHHLVDSGIALVVYGLLATSMGLNLAKQVR